MKRLFEVLQLLRKKQPDGLACPANNVLGRVPQGQLMTEAADTPQGFWTEVLLILTHELLL